MKSAIAIAVFHATQLVNAQAGPRAFPGVATSWGEGRLDILVTDSYGDVYHKYHANPKSGFTKDFEFTNLTTTTPLRPAAVSWKSDRLDIFVNSFGDLVHKYWDGGQWQPSEYGEQLADGIGGNLAVTAWSEGRFDIVAQNFDGHYVHKYYDGSAWKPNDNETESLGAEGFEDQYFVSDPATVSWGPDRLDIFGILSNGTLLHKYWDGTAWKPSNTAWEQFGDNFHGQPLATSWGKDRFDVWALQGDIGALGHRYWDGSQLSEIEVFGGLFTQTPTVTHWDKNRIDIFATIGLLQGFPDPFLHRYWDGHQWNPTDPGTLGENHGPKGLKPYSVPTSVSWGKDNINAFFFDKDGKLRWQFWEGSQWLPAVTEWYDLGILPTSLNFRKQRAHPHTAADRGGRQHKQDHALRVQGLDDSLDL